MSSIKRMFKLAHRATLQPIIRNVESESKELYRLRVIAEIPLFVPSEYEEPMKKLLTVFSSRIPEAHKLMKANLRGVFGHPKPLSCAFWDECAFISDQAKQTDDVWWHDTITYLLTVALIIDALKQNRISIVFRWSRARREARIQSKIWASHLDDVKL